jgi:hypothetical protein
MHSDNDFAVIDCLLTLLELFTVKNAKASTCDLAEELQHHLFTGRRNTITVTAIGGSRF